MSVKDLKDALEKGNLSCGIRQVLKSSKSKKKSSKIYVAKDAREEVVSLIQEKGLNFEFSKTKTEIAKELGMDFESEVFLIE